MMIIEDNYDENVRSILNVMINRAVQLHRAWMYITILYMRTICLSIIILLAVSFFTHQFSHCIVLYYIVERIGFAYMRKYRLISIFYVLNNRQKCATSIRPYGTGVLQTRQTKNWVVLIRLLSACNFFIYMYMYVYKISGELHEK